MSKATQSQQIEALMNTVAELTARLDRAGKYAKGLEQRIQVLEEQARYRKPGLVTEKDRAAWKARSDAAREEARRSGQAVVA